MSKNRKAPLYCLVIAIVFILFPICCIMLSGEREDMGRLIAISVVIPVSVPALVLGAFAPVSVYLRPNAKLNRKGYEAMRRRIIILHRVGFIVMAASMLYFIALPFMIDVIGIAKGGSPSVIRGSIVAADGPLPMLEFLSQSIIIDIGKGQKPTYYFLYPLCPRIHKDKLYEIKILHRSHIVLQASRIRE